MLEVGAALIVVGLAALAFQAGRLRERIDIRDEVGDILGPIRTDIDNLHDRFDHWTKRERRRRHVEKGELETDGAQADLMSDPAVRRAQLRLRVKNGPVQETPQGS